MRPCTYMRVYMVFVFFAQSGAKSGSSVSRAEVIRLCQISLSFNLVSSFFPISSIALPIMLLAFPLRTRAPLSSRCIYKPYAPSRSWTLLWLAGPLCAPPPFSLLSHQEIGPVAAKIMRARSRLCMDTQPRRLARSCLHRLPGKHAVFRKSCGVHSSLKLSSTSKHSRTSERFNLLLLQSQPVLWLPAHPSHTHTLGKKWRDLGRDKMSNVQFHTDDLRDSSLRELWGVIEGRDICLLHAVSLESAWRCESLEKRSSADPPTTRTPDMNQLFNEAEWIWQNKNNSKTV